MNIFYLDENIDKCAEYHIDSHVVKMPTEAAQMLTTTIWVDHLIGYVPRALTKDELKVINEFKAKQPSIEERTFTRFLPTHINHPCTIWARTSLTNYFWLFNYVDALNNEYKFRYRHRTDHKSYTAAFKLPEVRALRWQDNGITPRPKCMPEEYQEDDVIASYRMYYMVDKADFAVWKRRDKPHWWDKKFVEYMNKDPHESYLNTVKAPANRGKPHSQDYIHVR